MALILFIVTIVVMASPIQTTQFQDFQKALSVLEAKIENLEKDDSDLKEKIEEMERNEDKMKEDAMDMRNEIISLKKNENDMKNHLLGMEEKLKELEMYNEVKDLAQDKIDKNKDLDKNAEGIEGEIIVKAENNTEDRLSYLEELSKLNLRRSCHELSQYGVSMDNFYYVDPDGPLVGSVPIRVWCEFSENGEAITEILHNAEEKIDVDQCHDPGCYVKPVVYSAPDGQIQSLIGLSQECEQSIEYNCLLAPLEKEGIHFGYWLDRLGRKQIYWDGANSGNHVCGCHFTDQGCIEEETTNVTCNCNAGVPELKSDVGTIRDMSALPITELHFGGLTYQIQQASHKLGRLRCWGEAEFDAGTSCTAIKRAGEFRSGYYNVRKSADVNSELVYCKSTPGYEGDDEVFVESSEDHFQDVESTITEMEADITDTKTDLSKVASTITEMEAEITETKSDLSRAEANINNVEGQVSILEEKMAEVKKRSDYCAYQSDNWRTAHHVITYDKLILSNNYNIPGAKMDINTGEFTAGVTGIYQVDFSMRMAVTDGFNYVYLRHNDVNIPESRTINYINGGRINDIGGRHMLMKLNVGDRLSVYADAIETLVEISFCINLAK